MTHLEETGRRRGSIRQRASSLQVRFFAGKDPVTGRDVYLTASIPGTDKKAYKKAEDKLAEFRTKVNKQRSTPSSVKLRYAIDEWMRTSEHEDSTREAYRGYIARTIRPALGDVPVNKLTARMLETFYAELRRCRACCDRRPFVEHKAAGPVHRAPDPLDHQRYAQRRHSVGLDQHQPHEGGPATETEAAAARPPVASGGRQTGGSGVRDGRRLGNARLARDDHGHPAWRGLRAAVVARRP
ncbi:MAG: hypothetical protein ACRDRR_05885 [Pseudonocardiaceae bacterium]